MAERTPLTATNTTDGGNGQEFGLAIRKLCTYAEHIFYEGGRQQPHPVRVAAAAAIVQNPFAGFYVEDLKPLGKYFSPVLGKLLADSAVATLDQPVEAYGKGAVVGENGEVEHGSAIIHTLKFGDPLRALANGAALVPSAEKRGGCGACLDLALKHKDDPSIRTHHWTFEVRIPDAPCGDEIVVWCAVAGAGRPNARIGRGPGDDKREVEE
jgi:Amino acid synthesis